MIPKTNEKYCPGFCALLTVTHRVRISCPHSTWQRCFHQETAFDIHPVDPQRFFSKEEAGFLDGQYQPRCHCSPLIPQGTECFLAQLGLYLLSELLIGVLHNWRHASSKSSSQSFRKQGASCLIPLFKEYSPPQATQCADRFHLLKNLAEALEDLLARHLSASRKQQVEVALKEQTPAWRETRTARRSHASEDLPSAYQQERLARYQQVIKLREPGMTQSAIAQQIGLSLQTVQRWLAAGAFPQRTRQHYVSRLDPYLPYLFQRWTQRCHNIAQLFRELEALGYQGSYASVHDNLVRRLQFDGGKTPANVSSKTPPLATPRQAAFLILRRPEQRRAQEQETVTTLRQIHPEVELASDLVQQFVRMVRTCTGEQLDA